MEKKIIPAPIDNKNLMEDPFEDEVFADLYAAEDHRERGVRHLIGLCTPKDENGFPLEDGIVDVRWAYGGNTVTIRLIAVNPCNGFEVTQEEVFRHYKEIFKSWECEENQGLVVSFDSGRNVLYVHFNYDLSMC